ncbi:MAG TPA: alpha/beta hydrolase [Acidimicrobiia bacterium]|nr:alpha/beta hydrolase [Acidimicrobiia bacterium]
MLRRPALILLVLVACSGEPAVTTTTSPPQPPVTTTSPPSSVPTTQVELPHLLTSTSLAGGLPVDIYGPDSTTDGPVAVLFHGGGWFGGDPSTMAPLASALAEQGMVAVNTTYRTSSGGYPESFEDVACAVRWAATEAGNYTTNPVPPLIVAHSAGAQLASVVALAGDEFTGDCPLQGSALPSAFVGLAGPYDVTKFTLVLASYFGTRFEVDPAPWEAGNAFTYLGGNPDLRVLLIHGEADELVPPEFSRQLAEALTGGGYAVTLEVLPGADHAAVRRPEVVGDLIANFTQP